MNFLQRHRIAAITVAIFVSDQITKYAVLSYLGRSEEKIIIPGFFKLVHWVNTGAAFSLFHGNNAMLAIISLVALLALFLGRHHFDTRSVPGQISMGLLFGGILGNLYDRLHPDRFHVIDFLRFYIDTKTGQEVGFPAFNIADTAICVGVGLLFLISWRNEKQQAQETATA